MTNFPRMPKPATGWPKLPEIITPTSVTFLAEQSEPGDEQFKRQMSRLFPQMLIRRAYLVRLTYDDSPAATVVLCMRYGEDIEHELARGFRHMFGEIWRTGDFYDWLILDGE